MAISRVLPRKAGADGIQPGSPNGHKLQGQLCFYRGWGWGWASKPSSSYLFLLPMATELDKRTRTLDTQPILLSHLGGQPLSQELGREQREVGPCRHFCSGWGEPRGSRAAEPRPLFLQGRGLHGRRDGIRAKIRFTNEAHGRSNFAITHSLLCN